MANKWVEFVRKWSRDHGVSYMCASTMPACKEEYKSGKAPKNTQKANKEQMGMEDKDVALPKKAKKGITADTLKDKISQIKEAKKMGVEDIKSALLRRAVGIVQPLQSADTAVVKPKGRPKKYATAEEAKRMKSVKTVEARKAKKAKEATPVVVPVAPTGARGDDLIHYSPKLSLTRGKEELRQIYNKLIYYSHLLEMVDWYVAYNGLNASEKSVDKALSVSKKIKEMIKGVLSDAFSFPKTYSVIHTLEDDDVASVNNPYYRRSGRRARSDSNIFTKDDLASIGIIEKKKGDGWVFKVKIFNKKVIEIEEELKSDEDRIRIIRASGAGYESSDDDMSEVSDDEIISRINKKGKVVHLRTRDEIMAGGAYDAEHASEMVDNYSMIINHLVEHISDPSEPVDPRDYDQAIHFIREIRRAKGGAEYYGGAVNSGNEFLDVIANTGHQMGQSHPASKFGLNPFDMGMKFGEKVVAPALMKTKLGNPHTGIFSKHFWSPKKRHGGAYTPVNSGNEFLDVIANTGHQLGQDHPASKFGLNPFDMGEKLGEKLGNAMMKTKLGNPKTGIFSKKFWTPKKKHH